jgi:hypothetical protein
VVGADVVEHDDVALAQLLRKDPLDEVSKTSASVAFSNVIIARTPQRSSAPIIVVTVPALRGAGSRARVRLAVPRVLPGQRCGWPPRR